MKILTIDSGTTNTRAYLVQDGVVVSSASRSVGSRDTAIDGNSAKLATGVRELIELFTRQDAGEEIGAVVASGMITSNMGLCEIPHLTAPVSRDILAAALVSRVIPAVAEQPILFIPGVKMVAGDDDPFCLAADMMRGEETETYGVLAQLPVIGPATLILPGSHSKFVDIDAQLSITGSMTTLAGELVWAIRQSTILANSLPRDIDGELCEEALLRGADCSYRFGLNRTCFSTRIMHVLGATTERERASFLLGAVFYQDVVALRQRLESYARPTVLIGGKKFFRDVYFALLRSYADSGWQVRQLDDKVVAEAVPLGAWGLWRRHTEVVSAGKNR